LASKRCFGAFLFLTLVLLFPTFLFPIFVNQKILLIMKKALLFFSLITTIAFVSCGPAAESKDSMHRRAKEVQDSIANSIKTAIEEVSATPNAVIMPDTTKKKPQ